MKTTDKIIGRLILGWVLACCQTTNLHSETVPSIMPPMPPTPQMAAQMTSRMDGLLPPGSGGDNGQTNNYAFFPDFNPTPVITYPTNTTILWSLNLGGYASWGAPALSPDGTLYVSVDAGNLSAIDTTTNPPVVKWTVPGATGNTVAIGIDGTVFTTFTSTTTGEGTRVKLSAINPVDGSTNWSYEIPEALGLSAGWLGSDPVVGPDGTVYIGGVTNFYAITNGQAKWIFNYPSSNTNAFTNIFSANYVGFERTAAALGNDGTLYINTDLGQLFAVNSTNGSLKWITCVFQNFAVRRRKGGESSEENYHC